jgi:hypothetical protein
VIGIGIGGEAEILQGESKSYKGYRGRHVSESIPKDSYVHQTISAKSLWVMGMVCFK